MAPLSIDMPFDPSIWTTPEPFGVKAILRLLDDTMAWVTTSKSPPSSGDVSFDTGARAADAAAVAEAAAAVADVAAAVADVAAADADVEAFDAWVEAVEALVDAFDA